MEEDTLELQEVLVENNMMTEKQAKAYCSYVVDELPREDAIGHGLSASSFDDRLRGGRDHVEEFMDLLVEFRTNGVVPVRQSKNSKQWHRVDSSGCFNSVGVMPSSPYRERLAFEKNITDLAGEPCEKCFPDLSE